MRPCVRWVGLELELAVENLDPPLASYFAFLRMAAGEAWDHIRLAALAHAHFRRRAHPPATSTRSANCQPRVCTSLFATEM